MSEELGNTPIKPVDRSGIGGFRLPPMPRRGVGEVYDPLDPDVMRKRVYAGFVDGLRKRFPMDNDRHILSLEDIRVDERDFGPDEQREAISTGADLSVRVRGRWRLTDKETGQEISRTNLRTVANIPWMTDRGTFIRSGRDEVVPMQMRMAHGAFARRLNNGGASTRVNVRAGTGSPFEVSIDPQKGVFTFKKGTTNFKLYPILHAMGVSDGELEKAWGPDILKANKAASTDMAVRSITKGLLKEAFDLSDDQKGNLAQLFSQMELDQDSVQLTLGSGYDHVTPSFMVDISRKTLGVARGDTEPDSRDSLAHQRILDVSDLLRERALMDSGKVARTLLWKASGAGNLDKLSSGSLNKWVDSFFKKSRLTQAPDESNLLDAHMRRSMVTRLGEGGMSDPSNAPMSAKLVDSSFQGFLDPVVTPEKMRTGLDSYLSMGVRKGEDGLLRAPFIDRLSGETVMIDPVTMDNSLVALPDTEPVGGKIPAFRNGKLVYANPREVRYQMSSMDRGFSPWGNLIPAKNHTKPGRTLVAAKHATQALSLVGREAPFVRTTSPMGEGSVESSLGTLMGAPRAAKAGVVESVDKGWITMRHADGTTSRAPIHANLPMNRHSVLNMTPVVKPGDRIQKGALLATSNFTDKEGNAALGRNLKVAYASYKGLNHKDAVVISESAAKKMSHQALYREDLPQEKNVHKGRKEFMAMFPGKFTEAQMKNIGDDGLAKVGTVVQEGDPLATAYQELPPGPLSFGRRVRKDASVVWDKPYPGVVSETGKGKKRNSVYVRANVPMVDGDKMTGRYQNKGVVIVVPDNEMMTDKDGNPFDVLLNPAGIPSRVNTGQVYEVLLGKIAERTGKPYDIPGFLSGGKLKKMVREELKKHNIPDNEDIIDPSTGRSIPGVLTGNMFMYKLSQLSDLKEKGRATGAYTQDDIPLAGGAEGGRRIGGLVLGAFMGHGANEMVKDFKLLQGQRNDDFWRTYKMGGTPPTPKTPLVYEKFLDSLRGAGITVREKADRVNVFAMTADEAKTLGGQGRVSTATTFDAKNFKPMKGGLFDPSIFGNEGKMWGYMELDEPVVNPVMEEPLKHILGMTGPQFETLMDNPEQLKKRLATLDLDTEMARARNDVKGGSPAKRDSGLKRMRAIKAMVDNDVKPGDFLMGGVPVLPPIYRPISIDDKDIISADANYLYKDLMSASEDLRDAKAAGLPDEDVAEARRAIRDSYRRLTGITDPDGGSSEKVGLGGMLRWALGSGSPKYSSFHRKVLGGVADHSGLAVITPNPSLSMDEVGMPEKSAWSMYETHVIRRMVRNGMPPTEAVRQVADHTPAARSALVEEMEERPVVISRAPALHKFNVLAMRPKLIKGSTLQLSPSVYPPLSADNDGDTALMYVPSSQEAVREARGKVMPSKNLFSARFFKADKHFVPEEEFILGSYLATRKGSGESVKFATKEEALAAYKAGRIKADTPITIGG